MNNNWTKFESVNDFMKHLRETIYQKIEVSIIETFSDSQIEVDDTADAHYVYFINNEVNLNELISVLLFEFSNRGWYDLDFHLTNEFETTEDDEIIPYRCLNLYPVVD